ncbi:MAG TPA: histidine kinase dimerization/phosphoacceptor domain -containing protein, partial [Spirochaetota bacterium]|nr:histidine kinase dimerization/phosphoacceptor domain -containing protein [Spirochaetota bacterium]
IETMTPLRVEVRINKKDNSLRWVSISSTPKILDDGLLYWDGVEFDITDIKTSEQRIKEALSEKEALLRELYHRTKNNMNVIISFLKLQSNRIDDKKTVEILNDAILRIYAMSLVHQKLYSSKNLSKIILKDYIEELVKQISFYFNVISGKVKTVYDIDDVEVVIDVAIPLGMVINEMITNSLKYAFNNMDSGIISIKIKKETDENIIIEISDNGVGLAHDFDIKNSNTLGLSIIFNIIESQLNGTISYKNENGLKYTIQINSNVYSERV